MNIQLSKTELFSDRVSFLLPGFLFWTICHIQISRWFVMSCNQLCHQLWKTQIIPCLRKGWVYMQTLPGLHRTILLRRGSQQGSVASPPLSLPPLWTSAHNEWRVPLLLPSPHVFPNFVWSFFQLLLSHPPLPSTHSSPNTWEPYGTINFCQWHYSAFSKFILLFSSSFWSMAPCYLRSPTILWQPVSLDGLSCFP